MVKRQIHLHTLFVLFAAVTLVGLGMLENIIPYFAKPQDRFYTGMTGYSDDFIGYVSYIKEGMYGRNTMIIRSLPLPQTPTPTHIAYILLGKAAGILGWSAPFAYHIGRFFFSLLFILASYRLFRYVFRNKQIALFTTIISFVASTPGIYLPAGKAWKFFQLDYFTFTENVSGRASGRPHYMLASALFVYLVSEIINEEQAPRVWKTILLACFAVLLGITHPSFGVLFALWLAGFVGFRIISTRGQYRMQLRHIAAGVGIAAGLLASYWSVHQYPINSILTFESYVLSERLTPTRIYHDLVAFGPLCWFGFLGFILLLIRPLKNVRGPGSLVLWLLLQMALFFFLYPLFRAERFRFIQSLYFIPMAAGAVLSLQVFGQILRKNIVIPTLTILLLVSIPTYVNGLRDAVYSMTDYHDYAVFIFPSYKQLDAYHYLDTHTETESTVLAKWEAANNILLYSHNLVVGNRQGWKSETGNRMEQERDMFFSGTLSDKDASDYLNRNSIKYIYWGYQEKSLGNIERYKFLEPVFRNNDVTIFKV